MFKSIEAQYSKIPGMARVIGFTVLTIALSILTVTCDFGDTTTFFMPLLVTGVLGSFLSACLATESIAKKYTFAGIGMLLTTAMGFLVTNMLSQTDHSLRLLLKRKTHYNVNGGGVLLVMGASAIVFGFLDNYGMKLGTDALEDGLFWKIGKSAMADPRDVNSKDKLETIKTYLEPNIENITDFTDAAMFQNTEFEFTDYQRYKAIKDAGSMMGNTFSDFVGALLGAGVGKLFEYLTGILGDKVDDPGYRILAHPVTKVVLEATFIALGCMVPVGMHFRKASGDLNDKFPLFTGSNALIFTSFAIVFGLVLSQWAVQPNGSNVDVDPFAETNSHEAERMEIGRNGLLTMIGILVLMTLAYTMQTTNVVESLLTRLKGPKTYLTIHPNQGNLNRAPANASSDPYSA
jgi:hypothetical protein